MRLRHRAGFRTNFVNFRLRSSPFICYKQFTESRCVASRRICCISRHRPASKFSREHFKFSIVPATGLHSDSNWFHRNRSEGYLQSKDLQASVLFSISCLPSWGAQNVRRKWRFTSAGRPYCCACQSAQHSPPTQSLVIPNGFIVRNLLSLAALLSRSPNSHCGNPLEILWEASIDGIHSAPVCL